MSSEKSFDCKLIRPHDSYAGKQGFSYIEGIPSESAGSKGIAMMLLTVPSGRRAKARLREAHETAIYVLSGEAMTYRGQNLEHATVTKAGDMFFIPAAVDRTSCCPAGEMA